MNKIRLGNKVIYYQVFYKKIKHMYLRYKNGHVMISCNKNMSIDRIEQFIMKHQDKITKSIDNQKERLPLYTTDKFLLFGSNYNVSYHYGMNKNSFQIDDFQISIWFKTDVFNVKYIENIYKELTIKITKQLYRDVYDEISNDINIDNITFKSQLMKSRFGSCIPKKRIIKLNSILARFDQSYIKTILIHELIHLAISNHQKAFYEYINRYIPNYKQIIKHLNIETRKYVI